MTISHQNHGANQMADNNNHDESIEPVAVYRDELKYFRKIIATYRAYYAYSMAVLNQKEREFHQNLSPKHQSLLSHLYLNKLTQIRHCVTANAKFIRQVVPEGTENQWGDDNDDEDERPVNDAQPSAKQLMAQYMREVNENEVEKVRSTLRQLVREWAVEGVDERRATYGILCDLLDREFDSVKDTARSDIRVLVPGAGLGRLAYDIASRGYSCQGNEFSFYMLLMSNFILNRCERAQEFAIHPWIHTFSNQKSLEHQIQAIQIPDVLPGNIPANVDFSMIAGEFLEVYADQDEEWDAVVTCFFIDTAHNIADYIECIERLLKPGGVWINLGPLLYHFENINGEKSIELTLEEVFDVVKAYGFTLQSRENVPSTYAGNAQSMLIYQYNSSLFVARKPTE